MPPTTTAITSSAPTTSPALYALDDELPLDAAGADDPAPGSAASCVRANCSSWLVVKRLPMTRVKMFDFSHDITAASIWAPVVSVPEHCASVEPVINA